LISTFVERSVTLREVIGVLRGRTYILLLILLALPFCTPIPLPVVSLPFGLAIFLIGLRLALGQTPWLPQRLLDVKLAPRFFARVLSATHRLVRALEFVVRPRWTHLLDAVALRHGYGTVICACGLLMLLPLPLPFSNGLPALTVVLLGCAMLERDGYLVIAGLAMFALTLGYFGAIAWGGSEVVGWLQNTFGGVFSSNDAQAP
jgi:hypothetical protein